jgi:tight adherence protein C
MTPLGYGLIFAWSTVLAGLLWTARLLYLQQEARARLDRLSTADAEEQLSAEGQRSWLGWWLYRAGFRSASAVPAFIAVELLMSAAAVAVIVLAYTSGLVASFESLLRVAPGGVGEVFLPLAWASPWLAGIFLAAIPALLVRARRRSRISLVEQDLPLVLDLLSTLAEAGLGFDAALDRILNSQPDERPLAQDLRLFQIDVLAGRTRVGALRRLMHRVDVTWFSIFISAVIHAEQVGSSLAQTLRTQADDLRMRRRERALAVTMALPVKLLIPLIVCFLPGIMTAAIAPVAFQIVQVLDQFLRGVRGS